MFSVFGVDSKNITLKLMKIKNMNKIAVQNINRFLPSDKESSAENQTDRMSERADGSTVVNVKRQH